MHPIFFVCARPVVSLRRRSIHLEGVDVECCCHVIVIKAVLFNARDVCSPFFFKYRPSVAVDDYDADSISYFKKMTVSDSTLCVFPRRSW